MADPQVPAPVDNAAKHRFEVELDGHLAELIYELDGNRLVLVHTEVPEALEGHGIAGALVQTAIDRARREGLTIVPKCPYARRWLQRHPKVAATVEIEELSAYEREHG